MIISDAEVPHFTRSTYSASVSCDCLAALRHRPCRLFSESSQQMSREVQLQADSGSLGLHGLGAFTSVWATLSADNIVPMALVQMEKLGTALPQSGIAASLDVGTTVQSSRMDSTENTPRTPLLALSGPSPQARIHSKCKNLLLLPKIIQKFKRLLRNS